MIEIRIFKDRLCLLVGKFCLLIDFDWLYAAYICNIVAIIFSG